MRHSDAALLKVWEAWNLLEGLMGRNFWACAGLPAVTEHRHVRRMHSQPLHHIMCQLPEPGACARRWEVLTCLLPWGNCSPWQVVINVTKRGKRPEIPPADELVGPPLDRASMSCYVALMKRCWAEDPSERPAFSEIACALRCASAPPVTLLTQARLHTWRHVQAATQHWFPGHASCEGVRAMPLELRQDTQGSLVEGVEPARMLCRTLMELVQSLEERPAAGAPAGFMAVARQAFSVAHSAASQGQPSARSLPPRPSLDAPSRSLQPPRASLDAPGRARVGSTPPPGEAAFAHAAQVLGPAQPSVPVSASPFSACAWQRQPGARGSADHLRSSAAAAQPRGALRPGPNAFVSPVPMLSPSGSLCPPPSASSGAAAGEAWHSLPSVRSGVKEGMAEGEAAGASLGHPHHASGAPRPRGGKGAAAAPSAFSPPVPTESELALIRAFASS